MRRMNGLKTSVNCCPKENSPGKTIVVRACMDFGEIVDDLLGQYHQVVVITCSSGTCPPESLKIQTG